MNAFYGRSRLSTLMKILYLVISYNILKIQQYLIINSKGKSNKNNFKLKYRTVQVE